ncbi:MAG: helix-turn-helix domain-containing protein [Candidatus Caldarchaeum sp.]|nr:helix-turn-helix domain-containing protein [Candidatus Caldarchaeum sp.]
MSEDGQTFVSEKVRRALLELGLTDYEVRAYIALVENGPMTASELSDLKTIPYSKVYEVLNALAEKGFIESQMGRPAKYFPKSPATAVESLVQSIEKNVRHLSETVVKELMPVFEKRGGRERPDIWILRGEESIMEKVREVVSRCDNELLVAAPALSKEIAESMRALILSARARDARVQVMASSSVNPVLLKRLAEVSEVRVREQMFGGGIICDNREVVIVFSEDDGPMIAIWSDHTGLAKFAKNYFEYLWRESAPFKLKQHTR